MATAREAIKKEKMPVSTQDSIGVRFIRLVVDAPTSLHDYRAKCREEILKEEKAMSRTLRQMMMGTLMGREEVEVAEEEEEEKGDEVSTDEAGWSTEDSAEE